MKYLFKGSYWLIICHFCLFFLTFYFLYLCNIIHAIPCEGNISQWDAGWYATIVQSGYAYVEGKACNLAFFPLFPLMWKATGLSFLGISVLNLVLLMVSSSLLVYAFQLTRRETLLMLSLPSMFFCFVPYSESVFFLSASILLVGLHKEKLWLSLLGVFLASTARSASLIFLPILIFLAILYYASCKQKVREFFFVGVGSLVGSLAVFLLQFVQTGKFVEIFKVQAYWNRVLQWPEFPITTWDRFRLVWLDGLAFLAGAFAVVLCCVWLWRRYRNNLENLDSAWVFSVGYLAMMVPIALFYCGKDGLGGTSIYSLNRFVFATPFFAIAFVFVMRRFVFSLRTIVIFCSVCFVVWGLFGVFPWFAPWEGLKAYAKVVLYFAVVSLYAALYLLQLNEKWGKRLWPLLYVVNFVMQIHLFNTYLYSGWVG